MSDITIDQLQIELDAEAKKASAAIDKLQSQLDKLATSMATITQGSGFSNFEKLSHSLRTLSGVTIPKELPTSISTLASAVSKFGSSSVTKGITNIPIVSNGLTQMSYALGFSNISANANSIATLVNALSKLGGAKVGTAITNIPQLNSMLRSLGATLNGINVGNTIGLTSLANAITRLGGKTSTNAITNIPALTNAIQRMMTSLSKAPRVSQNLINMTNAMANLASQGQRVASASNMFNQGMNKTASASTKGISAFGSLSKAIGKFYAEFYLIIRGLKMLWGSIEKTMDYIETYNYFDAAFGQVASSAELGWKEAGYENAEAYVQSFETRAKELTQKMSGYLVEENGKLTNIGGVSLGMDPDMLLNYQAQYAQMSSSMGVASEYAVKLSDAMTRLGADLASVKNLDFADAYTDLSSGLVGMSRTMDKFGVNIRNVNLQQKLLDIGITTNIRNLNQNDKALLRSIIILDSTRYAWADLSDTLEQPANQLRMLKANMEGLSRTIGGIFLSSVAGILPYINGLVIALQRLAQWITSIFGIQLPTVTSQASTGLSDMMEEMEDGLDGATGSAKKLKNSLLGIDELNVLNQDTNASGTGVGGSADTEEIQKAFDAIYDEYLKAWDDAYARVDNEAQRVADRIQNAFTRMWKAIEPFRKALKNVWEVLKTIGGYAYDGLVGFYDNFLEPIGNWAFGNENTGLTRFSNIVAGLLDKIEWDKITNNLKEFWKAIEPYAEQFGEGLIDFFEAIGGLAVDAINFLGTRVLPVFTEFFKDNDPQKARDLGQSVGVFATSMLLFNGLKTAGIISATTALQGLSVAAAAVVGVNVGKWLNEVFTGEKVDETWSEMFDDIKRSIDNNTIVPALQMWWDDIIEGIKSVPEAAKIAWKDFRDWWQNTTLGKWFEEDVKPWFLKEVWKGMLGAIPYAFFDTFMEIMKVFGLDKWIKEVIKPLFSKSNWENIMKDIPGTFEKIFKNAINLAIGKVNQLIDYINDALDISWDDVKIAGQTVIQAGHVQLLNIPKIPTFAQGGFPNAGDIFVANEAGPEMVGSFGNRTAVANNDQIVEGIADGVRSAVAEIMIPYLSQIASNTRETAEKDFSVNIGDRDIARANYRGQRSMGSRLITEF